LAEASCLLREQLFSQDERRKFVDDVGYDVMGHIDRFEQGSVEFSFTEALNGLADEAGTLLASKVGAGVADLPWKN
jgi:hypothetical protein